jgi:NAD(P)-dependent dehydrogenase (short-subunit alcohol dehydrogenase family)
MSKLNGKIAIVTGGGSGIGRASAVLFAREGAMVVVADVDEGRGTASAGEIGGAGGRAEFRRVDVADPASVQALIQGVVSRHGRVDVLFNNAGIGGHIGPFAECTDENFDRVIAINLKGVFNGMKYGIAAMLAQGGGAIVNTASVAGLIGARGFAAYCASKGGVIQLTKVAALEYAEHNIRVNCICPGVVDTPILGELPSATKESIARINPMRRMAQPAEIASMALFLASDDASFATGGVFVVDGGTLAQ